MSRKRRMFDIDLPDEIETGQVPAQALRRRGPMAAAIAENAEAVQARKDTAEQIHTENAQLAHEYVALQAAGQVVRDIPLDEIRAELLVRDRMPGEDEELTDLMASIRDVGLSNPIRVLPRPDGAGYELVQGFRRLTAYRRLNEETGQSAWAQIPALVMPGAADVAELYRRMVDENVIRKDLSFAEMAQAARNYLADPATGAQSLSKAVAALFQSAPYSKRSYIRSFAGLLEDVGDALRFPTAIPRAVGVAVARVLKDAPERVTDLRDALETLAAADPADEVALLRRFAGEPDASPPEPTPDAPVVRAATRGKGRGAKTTFHLSSSAGPVKCTAGRGRLEIKVDRDFSSIDRARLEAAIASLVDGLA